MEKEMEEKNQALQEKVIIYQYLHSSHSKPTFLGFKNLIKILLSYWALDCLYADSEKLLIIALYHVSVNFMLC